jgi:hypothetical protein
MINVKFYNAAGTNVGESNLFPNKLNFLNRLIFKAWPLSASKGEPSGTMMERGTWISEHLDWGRT